MKKYKTLQYWIGVKSETFSKILGYGLLSMIVVYVFVSYTPNKENVKNDQSTTLSDDNQITINSIVVGVDYNYQKYKKCKLEISSLYYTTELDSGRVSLSEKMNKYDSGYWKSFNDDVTDKRKNLIELSRYFQNQAASQLTQYDANFDYEQLLFYIKEWNNSNIGKPLNTR